MKYFSVKSLIMTIGGSIVIGLATCGMGRLGDFAKGAAKAYEMASGASDMARAGADMYENGVSVGNAFQMAAGGLGAAAAGASKCFTEGTQIVVGEIYDENDVFVQYVTVNIENVKVGDYVLACDVETGEVSLCPVTETYVRTSDHIRYLTTEDENGIVQTFETTDSHPIWVVTENPDFERLAREFVDENGIVLYHENLPVTEKGFYVEAKNLRVGDVFLGPNGELVTLTENCREEYPDGITVYNFEVEGNHNYYVIASIEAYEYGATAILVHNAGRGYIEPNDGITKTPHGGPNHNKAIDDAIEEARDLNARNIRKNQAQVDLDGNKVGNNRPDVQYDLPVDGVSTHINIEFDNIPGNSQNHFNTITGNDPDSIVIAEIIR